MCNSVYIYLSDILELSDVTPNYIYKLTYNEYEIFSIYDLLQNIWMACHMITEYIMNDQFYFIGTDNATFILIVQIKCEIFFGISQIYHQIYNSNKNVMLTKRSSC